MKKQESKAASAPVELSAEQLALVSGGGIIEIAETIAKAVTQSSQPVSIGSQAGGCGAGKVTFNPF